jgi:hypothetical protein
MIASYLAITALAVAAAGTSAEPNPERSMQIRIHAGNDVIPITLDDNRAAREFAAQLPLTLELRDYGKNEKIADLPRRIDVAEAPAAHRPSAGDVAYYSPWGNLAIFVADGHRSDEGLVRLGRVERGLDALRARGAMKVTIEVPGAPAAD